jgi:hypothetical protein
MTQKTDEISREIDTNLYRTIMEQRCEENLSLKPEMRIRLGIDFGTSFSKVAWRMSEDTCYPLCFGEHPNSLEDYLVPSVIAFDSDNLLAGFETKNQSHKIPNFKICLACESSSRKNCNLKKCSLSDWETRALPPECKDVEAAFVTAFYLAKLLNLSKLRVRREFQSDGRSPNTVVKWSVSVPVPEKYIEDSPVAASFEETLKIAWLMAEVLAEMPEMKNISTLFSCFKTAKEFVVECQENGRKFDCSVYPEVGAEVASITMSPTSEPGLYAFVDIGAGTVDASVFRFYRDDGDAHRPPYAAEVFNLGAAHFETKAQQFCPNHPKDLIKSVKERNYPIALENSETLKEIKRALRFIAGKINRKTEEKLTQVFREGYNKEPLVDRWRDLKLVLGGGGASLITYRKAAKKAFSIKEAKEHQEPPQTVELNVPNDFKMTYLSTTHFHRFAVAYGLSWGKVNLPEIVTPKEVKPIKTLGKREIIDPTNDG